MVAAVAAVVVGAVFAVSGVAKIAEPERWKADAAAFGAPRLVVAVLPWIEVLLAGLLVAQLARPIVALCAAGVLTAFTVALGAHLRAGRRPVCACFGAWSARPIGAWHVVRNVGLVAVALVAVFA